MHIFKYFEDKKNISTGDNSQNMNVLSFLKLNLKMIPHLMLIMISIKILDTYISIIGKT